MTTMLHVVIVHHAIFEGSPRQNTQQMMKCMMCTVAAKSKHAFALPMTAHRNPDPATAVNENAVMVSQPLTVATDAALKSKNELKVSSRDPLKLSSSIAKLR
eukprot:CAMPEP_0197595868 /NCGR_PEP_ID=MMETSP1326-20131121/23896_1 /TAXON_ID=1155430 /ORGANISM="Genus nov. species nov., Strain RCC2288" /LENGTH=101 /DNA_ID=CAMNT_0043162295 /DNA_START=125 /DNA_END=430 /DNA_ORIENTATION=+